jgi:hypothetical protein
MTSSRELDDLLRRRAGGAVASAPEAAFWRGVVANMGASSPNWGLDLHAGRGPLAVDAFVYLVDSSNLWLASAAIAPEQLAVLLREQGVGSGGTSFERALAAQAIAAASDAGTRSSTPAATPETLRAFAAGLVAVARSPGYAAACEELGQRVVHQHWILLLYRLANGNVKAGLGYAEDANPGMLDRAQLLEFVESIAEMDLGTEGTIVNQAAKEAGGVRLASELQHIVVV